MQIREIDVPVSHETKVLLKGEEIYLREEFYNGETQLEAFRKLDCAVNKLVVSELDKKEITIYILYRQRMTETQMRRDILGVRSTGKWYNLIAAIFVTKDDIIIPWE